MGREIDYMFDAIYGVLSVFSPEVMRASLERNLRIGSQPDLMNDTGYRERYFNRPNFNRRMMNGRR